MKKNRPNRRDFLKVSSAATGAAAGSHLTGCASETESDTKTPVARRTSDDPHAGATLPGREKVYRPAGRWPVMRTNWDPKNVIVVMLDSLRADHVGAFGNAKVPTPNLDKFAAESTFFRHSYPEGLPTVPVRTSLFSGKFTYPFRPWQVLYPEDHPLLSEILWSQGFRSALISDVYHMHKPAYAFDRGFDDVVWIRGQEGDPFVRDPSIQVDIEPYYKGRTDDPNEAEQLRTYLTNRHDWKSEDDHFTPRVINEALGWLKRQKKKENLFLWVDSFCPHEPWDPPDRYLKMVAPDYQGTKLILPTPGDVEGYLDEREVKNVMSLYGAVVRFVDDWVGHFLDELRRMGLFENSLIILMSDHGEPFGEHGIVRKVRPWPYEELARTMLMIREPGGKGVGSVGSYTQQTDITATILEYLGIPAPPEMSSVSLMPLILGEKEKIRDSAVCCHYRGGLSIRHQEWSYHYYLEGAKTREDSKLIKDGPELYNLRDDPGEQNNLIAKEPDRAGDLDRMLRNRTEELIEHEMKFFKPKQTS